MDDTRTQQALDELADLFLTGNGPAAAPPVKPQPVASTGDTLDGPAPIKLSPKLTEPAASPIQDPRPSAVQGDAPLRLQPDPEDSPIASIGEDQTPAQTSRDTPADEPTIEAAPAQTVAVEAVILGNLPGLSGPWLTQYAQLLAQQEGPVAILHVDDDLIDIELVEPTGQDSSNQGVSLRMPPGGGGLDPASVLTALLDSSNSTPTTVLVHLDPQNDEQGLSRALALEDWTLMCGADDAAVVGGYRMLKTLVEQTPAVARKRVGLMVMGSDPKESQEAARKVQSAAQSFLNTPVQLLGWQKQMVPVNLRHLGRFEDADAVWPGLVQWFNRYAPAEPALEQEPEVVAVAAAPAQPQAPTEQLKPAESEPKPATIEVEPRQPASPKVTELFDTPPSVDVEPVKPRIPRPAQPVHIEQAVPAQTVKPEPEFRPAAPPQPVPAAAAQTMSDEPDLIELLMAGAGAVPGGVALEARCPHQPQTQLMLDQAGRLHLLRRHDSMDNQASVDGVKGLEPAMVDLYQARQWVGEHLSLLQLTQRQFRFDGDAQPVLHLFTDRADWATALIARLGDGLRFHLLQDVQVGQQRAWFCTPLN